MDLLFNELSVHGQFPDVATFKVSVGRVMSIRAMVMERFRLNLYCHRNVANRQVTQDKSLPQVIGALDRDSRQALMGWLARHGPFWEDVRKHGVTNIWNTRGKSSPTVRLGKPRITASTASTRAS